MQTFRLQIAKSFGFLFSFLPQAGKIFIFHFAIYSFHGLRSLHA